MLKIKSSSYLVTIDTDQRWMLFEDFVKPGRKKEAYVLHRDNNLPALIYETGSQIWFRNGMKYQSRMSWEDEVRFWTVWTDTLPEYWVNI